MCEDESEGFAQDYAIATTDNARLRVEVERLRAESESLVQELQALLGAVCSLGYVWTVDFAEDGSKSYALRKPAATGEST